MRGSLLVFALSKDVSEIESQLAPSKYQSLIEVDFHRFAPKYKKSVSGHDD